mmetsp:Transcript_17945/g.58102  ORF Transcript_17945/g.58102 Transcript_17945/m.58102 type:complete len:241 (-) Transcript_17945:182-904(-)
MTGGASHQQRVGSAPHEARCKPPAAGRLGHRYRERPAHTGGRDEGCLSDVASCIYMSSMKGRGSCGGSVGAQAYCKSCSCTNVRNTGPSGRAALRPATSTPAQPAEAASSTSDRARSSRAKRRWASPSVWVADAAFSNSSARLKRHMGRREEPGAARPSSRVKPPATTCACRSTLCKSSPQTHGGEESGPPSMLPFSGTAAANSPALATRAHARARPRVGARAPRPLGITRATDVEVESD